MGVHVRGVQVEDVSVRIALSRFEHLPAVPVFYNHLEVHQALRVEAGGDAVAVGPVNHLDPELHPPLVVARELEVVQLDRPPQELGALGVDPVE